MEKIINSQQELDNIDLDFIGDIIITGGSFDNPINLSKLYQYAYVILKDKAVINMYKNSCVNSMRDNSCVNNMRDNSCVNYMKDSSYVKDMWNYSRVKEMKDYSRVNVMRDNSRVNAMRDYSCIDSMRDYSCVNWMYDNSCVDWMWDYSYIINMWDNSCVKEMRDNSSVNEMKDYSWVNVMRDDSSVNNMKDYSCVNYMWDNSSVNSMRDYSCINYLCDNSYVDWMKDNSCVNLMKDNSCVKNMYDNAKATVYSEDVNVNCFGNNYVFISKNINDLSNIKLNDSSKIIHDTFETNQSVDFYLKKYNVKKKDENTLIMYKAVHKSKIEGEYFSDYDKNFIYKIGQTLEHECSNDIDNSCTIGLHISDLAFAKQFGSWWEDLAIIECEVPISDIVISKDCNGKVRTSRLTVIKEIN